MRSEFSPYHTKRAFSLLEILLTLGVISILGVIVVSVMRDAVNRADKLATIGNWRQISQAIFTYIGDQQGRFPGPLLSLQYATYRVTYSPGDLAYYLAPYLEPGLEGNGQRTGNTYTVRVFQSPAMRKASPLGDKAMQFHMNITLYTEGDERIYPFGYRPNGTPVMHWSAVDQVFLQYGAHMGEIPMFMMLDRYAKGWNSETFAALGVMPEPLFGDSRLALYFDGHVGDYYPGVKGYPTTGRNGLSLSGNRR